MAEFDIHYQSNNIYDEPVSEAIFEFCIVPCNDHSQTLTACSIANSLDESIFTYKNGLGFEINRVRTTKSFKKFKIALSARIDKKELELPDYTSLSIAEEKKLIKSNDFFIENHLFMRKTPFTTISKSNLSKLLKFEGDKNIFNYLQELNKFIFAEIKYQKNTTDVKTTVDQVLKLKSGVCQDFTHLFIAIARCSGIPARYTSGYLNQGKKFVGAMFMHAWVEAFVPGAGWVGFDPTNNHLVDMNYIKVAHGIDYTDCSPIKGVLKTTGENKTTHQVKVMEV